MRHPLRSSAGSPSRQVCPRAFFRLLPATDTIMTMGSKTTTVIFTHPLAGISCTRIPASDALTTLTSHENMSTSRQLQYHSYFCGRSACRRFSGCYYCPAVQHQTVGWQVLCASLGMSTMMLIGTGILLSCVARRFSQDSCLSLCHRIVHSYAYLWGCSCQSGFLHF